MPAGPARPELTPDNAPFWDAAREGRLALARCGACGRFVHPPAPVCPLCHTTGVEWVDVEPVGTVDSFTVNHQPMRPGLEVPYAIVLVEPDGAPGVRLTLRLDGDPATAAIGRRVRIGFEVVDDDWMQPVAEALDEVVARHHTEPGRFTFEPRRRIAKPEDGALISGVARSAVGKVLRRSGLDLAVEASLGAIRDAGLEPGDIDGIATYPGGGVGPPGYAGPGTDELAVALGLELGWQRGGAQGAGQLQPVIDAVHAVAGGLCRHALVYRASTESTATALLREGVVAPPPAQPVGGPFGWLVPFDAMSPANWLAPYATAHMHRFGTTREQLGAVAITDRAHAALAPWAVATEPLTMEAYLSARPISTPLHLFDCDVPVDGAVAIVVSAVDTLDDLRAAPVRFEAVGAGVGFPPSWDQWPDLTTMAAHGAAATMWARTELTPSDLDVAQVYDGFTFLALYWLEALGVCGHGEAGPFVEGGRRIALGGELPANTSGGQLSGGRLHAWGLLEEACRQLRGEADGRQVDGAEVAVVTAGGGPIAGSLLLTR
ncbi:MAG: OB-fold domain-containing protein [Acidimicrobiales bacterium]